MKKKYIPNFPFLFIFLAIKPASEEKWQTYLEKYFF